MDGGNDFTMSNRNPSDNVTFTALQLQYLESVFPQVVCAPTTSEAAIRFYFGQQAVLEVVRNKTRGLKNGLRD